MLMKAKLTYRSVNAVHTPEGWFFRFEAPSATDAHEVAVALGDLGHDAKYPEVREAVTEAAAYSGIRLAKDWSLSISESEYADGAYAEVRGYGGCEPGTCEACDTEAELMAAWESRLN